MNKNLLKLAQLLNSQGLNNYSNQILKLSDLKIPKVFIQNSENNQTINIPALKKENHGQALSRDFLQRLIPQDQERFWSNEQAYIHNHNGEIFIYPNIQKNQLTVNGINVNQKHKLYSGDVISLNIENNPFTTQLKVFIDYNQTDLDPKQNQPISYYDEIMINTILGSSTAYVDTDRRIFIVAKTFQKIQGQPHLTGNKFVFYKSTGTGTPELAKAGSWQVTSGVGVGVHYRDPVLTVHYAKVNNKILAGDLKETSEFIQKYEQQILRNVKQYLMLDVDFNWHESDSLKPPQDTFLARRANTESFYRCIPFNLWIKDSGAVLHNTGTMPYLFIPGLSGIDVNIMKDHPVNWARKAFLYS